MGERTIKLPDVGEGIAEAELVEWHVKVGDMVREDSILAAVMTDKATVEIPSPADGKVSWLGAEYETEPKAKQLLRQALDSRLSGVRLNAAIGLARKKDPVAFDALAAFLNEPQWAAHQTTAANALQQLGDARAAELFLDRIERDPTGAGNVLTLFGMAGQFRAPQVVPRLVAMMEKKEWRRQAFAARKPPPEAPSRRLHPS